MEFLSQSGCKDKPLLPPIPNFSQSFFEENYSPVTKLLPDSYLRQTLFFEQSSLHTGTRHATAPATVGRSVCYEERNGNGNGNGNGNEYGEQKLKQRTENRNGAPAPNVNANANANTNANTNAESPAWVAGHMHRKQTRLNAARPRFPAPPSLTCRPAPAATSALQYTRRSDSAPEGVFRHWPVDNKKKADNSDELSALSSGGRTRTSDLWVMSPTSCQLLHPAMYRLTAVTVIFHRLSQPLYRF